MTAYSELYRDWQNDPDAFWLRQARGLDWHKKPKSARPSPEAERSEGTSWFADGMINACWNALDRHVEAGRGAQLAIIHDSPVTGTISKITYQDLRARVALFAGALHERGIQKGDRVVIYMPMIPEALIAMLACARIGAIHSVVFGGFAAHELAVRIDDCQPKAVISASCGIDAGRVLAYKPLLDAALQKATHEPSFCVIFQRPELHAELLIGRDIGWHGFQAGAKAVDCTPVEGDHPAYILYTSGTTGFPKGVIRQTAGHLTALLWSMKAVYDLEPGDVMWTASDVGWVVGHSYICYGPLLRGCTTVLYEGKPVGTPDASAFWRVISEHRVKTFFTAPTALRAIKREDPQGIMAQNFDLRHLRYCFLAGERADPDTAEWAARALGVPVIDNWWQTETGWPIAAAPMGVEHVSLKQGSATHAMPGYDIRVLDTKGQEVPPGTLGALALKLPLPPGNVAGLWHAPGRFHDGYLREFSGFYKTGDAGFLDEDGYVFVMGRTDDVINVSGHRLSTGAMEEVLASHPDVAECAVIGIKDALKGQSPLGLLCLNKASARAANDVIDECIAMMRTQIGPIADFKRALVVARLPKTRSGKILRATMAKIADGEPWVMPPTIDDAACLDEITLALESAGLGRAREISA